MTIDLASLKRLRQETSASVSDCRKAIEESSGDYQKALAWLKKYGIEKAHKKAGRETSQGLIESYIHQNGRVGVLVELLCETDFVARTDEFKNLAHELSMQVAAMNPKDIASLLKQEYIRDSSRKVEALIKETMAKVGENIVIKQFSRFSLGE